MFNQSQLQAFYFFESVTINGDSLVSDDWVGAFNGEVCVGARKWDTSVCGEGICDVPAMGYDSWNSEETAGYCMDGDIPTFKIYDASEDIYYDAIPNENFAFEPYVVLAACPVAEPV